MNYRGMIEWGQDSQAKKRGTLLRTQKLSTPMVSIIYNNVNYDGPIIP